MIDKYIISILFFNVYFILISHRNQHFNSNLQKILKVQFKQQIASNKRGSIL